MSKALPTKLKAVRGTLNRTREGISGSMTVQQLEQIPVAPDEFNQDQKDLWFDVCTTLHKVGLLQAIGLHQVKNYCRYFKIHTEAVADIEKRTNLITQTTNYGTTQKANPSLTVAQIAFSSMQSIADRFGFTPVAQSKIKEVGSYVKDPTNSEGEFTDL